jgi:hypothetical protein
MGADGWRRPVLSGPNKTQHGQRPPQHKITTRLLIQKHPLLLIEEVVPNNGILFRSIPHLQSALTSLCCLQQQQQQQWTTIMMITRVPATTRTTPLHSDRNVCNIAVQLVGSEDLDVGRTSDIISSCDRPSPPNGRAFRGTTTTGDAVLWLPAWTWQRVFVVSGGNIHTCTFDIGLICIRQNPVLALIIIPALIRELLGLGVQ